VAAPASNSPQSYAQRKLTAALRLWRGPLGALQRGYGVRAAPYIDPAAWAGFGTNNDPASPGGSARFWELGWAGIEGGPVSSPPPSSVGPDNTWWRLHDNARVIALLGRPATMAEGGWRQIEDQTAVGIVGLLDHGYSVVAGIDERLRPDVGEGREALSATAGGLWFTALCFMGWSAGTSRAVALVDRYADALAAWPEDGRWGLLLWLYALAAARGEYDTATRESHANPAYTLVRTWQKLEAGRVISVASGGDGSFFSLHARADWAWVSAVLTRAAYGGDAVTAQPSVTFRYDAETPRWKAALAASVLALVLAIGGTYARRRWRARPSAESSFIAPVDSSTEGG